MIQIGNLDSGKKYDRYIEATVRIPVEVYAGSKEEADMTIDRYIGYYSFDDIIDLMNAEGCDDVTIRWSRYRVLGLYED